MKKILIICILAALSICACDRVITDYDAAIANAEGELGLGQTREALDHYRAIARGLKTDPRWAGIMLRIAEIESNMMRDRAAADEALSDVIERAPLTEAGRIAREARARERVRQKDYQGAIEDYNALIKHFPEGDHAMRYRIDLAGVYLTSKDFRQSRIEVKPLVEGEGVPPEIREKAVFLAAESFFLEGQARKAAGYYEWLIRDFPNSPLLAEAKLHLATCIEELGYLGIAREVTRDAAKDYPNKGVIDARLKSIDERGTKPAKQMKGEAKAGDAEATNAPKKVYKEEPLN